MFNDQNIDFESTNKEFEKKSHIPCVRLFRDGKKTSLDLLEFCIYEPFL